MPDIDPSPAATPADPAGTATPVEAVARPPQPRPQPAPLFRVVEVGIDRDGRLRSQGKVWHTDVERVRRFGRVVAGYSPAACDVFVADSAGGVIERIPRPVADLPTAALAGWQALPLPPAPARVPPRPPRSIGAGSAPAAPAAPPQLDEVLSVGERTQPILDPAAVEAARAGRSVEPAASH